MATKRDRVGETAVNTDGFTMKIIEYRNTDDIDVLLDGKHIVTSKRYSHFKAGIIKNPYAQTSERALSRSRVGEKAVSKEGFTLEIVAYRSTTDVDILIDGKHTVYSRKYAHFKKGSVRNPHADKLVRVAEQAVKRVGETRTSKEGYTLELLAYRGYDDVDILIDGKHKVEGRDYGDFNLGKVHNPEHKRESSLKDVFISVRLDETNISNEGYSLKIVGYRSAHDIDVLVDGKHTVVGKRYDHFKSGAIHNPESHYAHFSCKKGETAVSNQGYSLEIVEYRSSKDMDVLVDGKHIITGVMYNNFKSGAVMNPDCYRDVYIGKTGVSNEGYTMTIVEYRDYTDIDVLLAGDVLVEHTTVQSFNQGAIGNPNHYRDKYLGVKSISNEGYVIEIVEYRNIDDIDVLVDNEYLVKNHRYSNFICGKVVNPYHKSIHGVGFIGVGSYSDVGDKALTSTACYRMWAHMLKRCYDPKVHNKHPSYLGCTVVETWHNFQNFAEWYYKNTYTVEGQRMSLDKDILVKGNKVYSPETCVIVPQMINSMFTSTPSHKKNSYPTGVGKSGKRYTAKIECKLVKMTRVSNYLGMFDTPELAFEAYKQAREAYIKQVADEYKDKIPQRLYDALYAYTVDIND